MWDYGRHCSRLVFRQQREQMHSFAPIRRIQTYIPAHYKRAAVYPARFVAHCDQPELPLPHVQQTAARHVNVMHPVPQPRPNLLL